jgi:hypothetical protein
MQWTPIEPGFLEAAYSDDSPYVFTINKIEKQWEG